jgi:hypothetical protein
VTLYAFQHLNSIEVIKCEIPPQEYEEILLAIVEALYEHESSSPFETVVGIKKGEEK